MQVVDVKVRMIVSVDLGVDESQHVGIRVDTSDSSSVATGHHAVVAQLWLHILQLLLSLSVTVSSHAWWSEDGWRRHSCGHRTHI